MFAGCRGSQVVGNREVIVVVFAGPSGNERKIVPAPFARVIALVYTPIE